MGHICHELLAALLVAVLLRHVVEHHQHAAAGLAGEGGQIELQCPARHLHLGLGVVGPLEGQHLLEGVQGAEQLVIVGDLPAGAVEHGLGGGVTVDDLAVVVKCHHAVGHVEEQGVQLVALVLHRRQGALENAGHLVKGPGQNADLVGGFHRQGTVKLARGDLHRSGGQLLDGVHHGLGQQEAQQHGDQQADDQRLHDDLEQLAVQAGHRVLGVQNVNDKGVVAAPDGHGHVHVVGGDVALVAHGGLVSADDGVPGGEQVGALLPGQGALLGGPGQVSAGGAVQHKVVPGAVVNAQLTGLHVNHIFQQPGAVLLGGGAAEVGDEIPLLRAEHAVHLLVEGVDEKAGDAGGQKRAHHGHQGRDEQQHDQRQLHMQTAEHIKSPSLEDRREERG